MFDKKSLVAALGFVLLTLLACSKQSPQTNVYKTKSYVYCDPAYVPLLKELAQVYETVNDTVIINVISIPENDAIQKLINDSISMIVASRNLDSNEVLYVRKNNKNCRGYTIAQDALSFIISQNDPDSIYTEQRIIETFTLNKNKKKIVFNENNSSTVNYINQILRPISLTSEAAATRSSEELIDYVSKYENSIGIIGSNFFSNMSDSAVAVIAPKIKIIGIKTDQGIYFPFQADIAAQKYPFARSIYVLNTEHYYGSLTGFKNFILSPTGQRIILKSGLMPVQMPNRLLNFVKSKNG